MKTKIALAFVFVLIVTYLFYNYVHNNKKNGLDTISKKQLEAVHLAYNTILDTYMVAAQKDFNYITKDKKVMKLLHQFKQADKQTEKTLRGELFRHLYKDYELMQELHVRQFHFHTQDGRSLLRFHKPTKSGDDLMNIRETIRIANEEQKSTYGFEGGRVYPGYRYVFPILDNGVYLGSVEFSVAFEGIETKLKNILPFYGHELILDKRVSQDKVFKKIRKYFSQSDISKNYFIENHIISSVTQKNKNDFFIKKLTKLAKGSEGFEDKINKNESFSLPILVQDEGYTVSFLHIIDTTHKSAGYIVSYGKSPELVKINERYNSFIYIGTIGAFILFFLLLVIIFQIKRVKDETQKLNKFIDIQNSVVILTDGKRFKFANKKFFDFFGHANLEDFLKKHNCICENFIEHQHFFSLVDVKEDEETWIDSLLNLPGRSRIVLMKDKISIPHAFTVSINSYDTNSYVVNFSDISDTMHEKLQLEEDIIRDPLTKAYNRIYFNKTAEQLVTFNTHEKKETGIVFFDIDHFKTINDTFGHQVGDDILVNLIKLVKENLRKSDKLIRWGGEEFIIIVPVRSLEELYILSDGLRRSIESHKFTTIDTLTCSFGLAMHSGNEELLESVNKADDKLYDAKNRGRNRVSY